MSIIDFLFSSLNGQGEGASFYLKRKGKKGWCV